MRSVIREDLLLLHERLQRFLEALKSYHHNLVTLDGYTSEHRDRELFAELWLDKLEAYLTRDAPWPSGEVFEDMHRNIDDLILGRPFQDDEDD